jgi:predicted RND superfamily exporter protein
MGLVGFATFRTLRGVTLPITSIGLAQIWTLAVIAGSGRSLNLVTFIVPMLIMAVGFAYAVHVVAEHDDVVRERGGEAGPEAVFLALKRVAFPVFLTALTTAAGFLSLTLSSLPAIREFGLFCVAGVTACLLASLAFAPAVLSLLPAPGQVASSSLSDRIERMASRVASFDANHGLPILLAGAVVAVIALVGVTRIEVSTALTKNLKPDHPLRRDMELFNRHFDGTTAFHVVLDTDSRGAFKRPENLEHLRELQRWLELQPEIRGTTSLADYLMVVNRAFHDGDPEYFAIPDSTSLISQYLFFLWNDQLEHFVDPRFSSASVMARLPSLDTREYAILLDRIEDHLRTLPDSFEAHVTGNTALVVRTIDDIAIGQALSLSAATLIIYAILVVYFRSFRIGFWALIPNMLPVVLYFGLLGLTGVTLNIITSLIACIVLGIAVDDTIHFLVRFREKLRIVGDETKAAVAALRSVARPVTSTSAALSLGFLVLATSSLKHQVEFGLLAAGMLAFAWLVDVTFTPALACRLGLARDEARGARP